ncbi:hypothetical protein NC651_035267 [Populus alba x Populus x berolinensis]|nr:hypothetical protein NC651_035267 [Populus alba x Populus x berolinensis]
MGRPICLTRISIQMEDFSQGIDGVLFPEVEKETTSVKKSVSSVKVSTTTPRRVPEIVNIRFTLSPTFFLLAKGGGNWAMEAGLPIRIMFQ